MIRFYVFLFFFKIVIIIGSQNALSLAQTIVLVFEDGEERRNSEKQFKTELDFKY